MDNESFLRTKFKQYYDNIQIEGPSNIKNREFGYGFYGKKISQRHLGFDSIKDLNFFLRNTVPFYISYSTAYYNFPTKTPMDAKGYLRSDIIYEFDADDIPTECKQEHDSWICKNCSKHGMGFAPEECPECGGKSFQTDEWVCSKCLNEVKNQVYRLLDLLNNDLGIREGISINFSGSKGYHVHVRSEKIQDLTPKARIEILDYLMMNGLDLDRIAWLENKTHRCIPLKDAKGLQERLLKKVISFIEKVPADEFRVISELTMPKSKQILENKKEITTKIKEGYLLPLGPKTVKVWGNIFEHCLETLKLNIDRQTSIDIKKIIRVPNTIHGGTGLLAKKIPLEKLEEFDPLKETILFSKNPVKIYVEKTPDFTIGGEKFSSLKEEELEVPEYVGVYLLAKNKAKLV